MSVSEKGHLKLPFRAPEPLPFKKPQLSPTLKSLPENGRHNVSLRPPKPPFKKSQPISKRSPRNSNMIQKAARHRVRELEEKLESRLEVAAGGILTLTKKIVAKDTSFGSKGEQSSSYTTRLSIIGRELQHHLSMLGRSAKLSSPHDRILFDSSYRMVISLWKEYHRLSACVVHRAALRKNHRSVLARPDSSSSKSKLVPSMISEQKKARELGKGR